MTASKIVAAAASSVGSSALDVDDVFSSFVYPGTGADQTITNDIDLSGEGGLVWLKSRTSTHAHYLFDTERGFTSGAGNFLSTNTTNNQMNTGNFGVSSFNSNGFSLHDGWSGANQSGADFISWTFRKAEKFFDIVTYTGNGTNRTIAHNLGSVPGMIIIKDLSGTGAWTVFHRKTDDTIPGAADYALNIGADTQRDDDATYWQDTLPTSTVFSIGTAGRVNETGRDFIAYLFAHNDGDGTFGPDEDQDIIKCGHYSGDNDDNVIDLGFEPQFIIVKNVTDNSTDWGIFDTARGNWQNSSASGDSKWIQGNLDNAESGIARFHPTSTGFGFNDENGSHMNATGSRYIYMAIRKGSLSPPEAASEVFNVASAAGSSGGLAQFRSTFRVDFALDRSNRDGTGYFRSSSRLTGTKRLTPSGTDAESNQSAYDFDYMTGFRSPTDTDANFYAWMWQRAPKFCDVVCWKGSGVARTISHNLGVAPEMMWVKIRNGSYDWQIYHSALGNTKYLVFNNSAEATNSSRWNNTTPTSSVFTLGNDNRVNRSGEYFYVNYMFATLAGISKVGSYTGNGGTQNIDCGFSNGAKLVIIKRSSNAQDWYVFDSARGIVAGADPALRITDTGAEVTGSDEIDPLSSGFTINQTGTASLNYSGHTYIFYAVAI